MPRKPLIALSFTWMHSPNGFGIYILSCLRKVRWLASCEFAERLFFEGLDVLNKLHNQVGLGVENQNNLQQLGV